MVFTVLLKPPLTLRFESLLNKINVNFKKNILDLNNNFILEVSKNCKFCVIDCIEI